MKSGSIKKENGFSSKKMNFCGTPGYFVTQVHNGRAVVQQFVREDDYDDFCEFIGCVPFLDESE